mgnify:CR=1 FL=1
MKIDTGKITVSFDFSPDKYFLLYTKDDRFHNGHNGGCDMNCKGCLVTYCLAPRISREYAGKDDDCGICELYLDDNEAEELIKHFTVVEM